MSNKSIKSFSDEAIKTLENASTNDVLEGSKKEIQECIVELKNKKKELDKDSVNLCFVGPYSSGKSTLINAILGYEILPEAIRSLTAKMFRIFPVGSLKDTSISFLIVRKNEQKCVELRWDEKSKTFRLCSEIQGSEKKINTKM